MDIDGLLLRAGNVTGPGFEPGEDVKTVLHDMVHVLVVGAGGLGCELSKTSVRSRETRDSPLLVAAGGDSPRAPSRASVRPSGDLTRAL